MKLRLFNIQRYSLHDGRGIRTNLFLKGCPLTCAWCANPESQHGRREVFFAQDRCIGCGECIEACERQEAICARASHRREGAAYSPAGTNSPGCTLCGKCAENCPSGALEIVGKDYTVGELLRILERDRVFYDRTGGGVTFSGGEPLSQPEGLLALAKACKEKDLSMAIETCGYGRIEDMEKIFPLMDEILYDVKVMDTVRHERFVGVTNEAILKNFKQMAARHREKITVRVPIICGVNEDDRNLHELKALLRETGVERVHFLPYHRLGENKYLKLSRAYDFVGRAPSRERLREICNFFRADGIRAEMYG